MRGAAWPRARPGTARVAASSLLASSVSASSIRRRTIPVAPTSLRLAVGLALDGAQQRAQAGEIEEAQLAEVDDTRRRLLARARQLGLEHLDGVEVELTDQPQPDPAGLGLTAYHDEWRSWLWCSHPWTPFASSALGATPAGVKGGRRSTGELGSTYTDHTSPTAAREENPPARVRESVGYRVEEAAPAEGTMVAEDEADVIVLGLGGIGSAAAYWLARSGARVIGLERFALGHDRGASQDHSRIIRLSYHDPVYVRLAQAAYETWSEVSAEAGAELVVKTGGIDIFPAEDSFDREAYCSAMDACGVPYERLDGAEAMRRFPELRAEESTEVLFQEQTGIAAAARANAAHQRLAREHGADLREHARVEAISADGDEVCVRAGGRTLRAAHLMVCAGPWTNDALALLGHELNLAVTREQVIYLEPQDPAAFAPERFPVWIWMQEPCYYGFPVFGEPAVKIAQDGGGAETTAETALVRA